nr:hypothetical protein Itr_chr10CG07960 [Ipomoea trifida]
MAANGDDEHVFRLQLYIGAVPPNSNRQGFTVQLGLLVLLTRLRLSLPTVARVVAAMEFLRQQCVTVSLWTGRVHDLFHAIITFGRYFLENRR